MESNMGDFQVSKLRESQTTRFDEAEGIDVLDILLVLAHDLRPIAVATLVTLLIGGVIAFLLLKPTFTASATILPPQQPQSSVSAVMGQLSSLANLGGGGVLKNPADMYVGMLLSRTVADRMIDRFHLQILYKTKRMEDTRKVLKGHITTEAGKDGLIQISVKDSDPRRASDLANGLIDELYRLTSTLAITEAAQRRLFFDQQLAEEKTALAAAEEDLRKTQERTGLIQLSGQAEEIIRSVAALRAQIVSREVALQAMRTFATDENPDLNRMQEEIAALRQELTRLENDQRRMQPGDIQVPTGRVPEVGLEYARKLREVTYHTALLSLLSKQYEAARIDEAKSAPVIQVIDRAVPPDKKSGPPRALLTLAAGILGFLAACFWSYIRHTFKRMKNVPENAEKLQRLQSMFGRRTASKTQYAKLRHEG
jgi:tyrosine-protein kinase Etk/Wzc